MPIRTNIILMEARLTEGFSRSHAQPDVIRDVWLVAVELHTQQTKLNDHSNIRTGKTDLQGLEQVLAGPVCLVLEHDRVVREVRETVVRGVLVVEQYPLRCRQRWIRTAELPELRGHGACVILLRGLRPSHSERRGPVVEVLQPLVPTSSSSTVCL